MACALILAFIFHRAILGAIGGYLVREQPPEQADVIIVLGGDLSGGRVLKGGELVRERYAPVALVSGPAGIYGRHECDFAIDYAVHQGYPEAYFRHMEHNGLSTREEARLAAPIFHQMGAHKVLIVTSTFHTHRAGNTFRAIIPDISFVVVGIPDSHFAPDRWWHDREGSKTLVLEWTKTIATWFGV